ncbi:MAG: hypothetical protein K9G39_01740 [Chlorobium sp.]|uniref:hypothetical protein n=1 Tax=Chlorobium sp. TaxID=1095 RepID=UPI0025C0E007|nr:hypothetical protein [Chlorobium sp.]MCF8382305.1 hypothetical protein [Chlorobium sp.]
MDMHHDARFAGVLSDLDRIARELVDTGRLAPIAGTLGSGVVIEFGMYGEGKNAEPAILINITSQEEFDGDESLLDDFEDYVISRLEVASRDWSLEVTDLLGDDRPVVLLINGEEY